MRKQFFLGWPAIFFIELYVDIEMTVLDSTSSSVSISEKRSTRQPFEVTSLTVHVQVELTTALFGAKSSSTKRCKLIISHDETETVVEFESLESHAGRSLPALVKQRRDDAVPDT